MKLTSNTIFITGATSGIGLELAINLLKSGNKVIISGRDEKALAEIVASHPEFVTRVCDVSKEEDIVATVDWLQKNHHVNVLINNAGIFLSVDLAHIEDLKIIESEMRINYFGPLKLISLMLPSLEKEKDPIILNVSSGLAYFPLSATPLYCASKAALHFYTLSLRDQLSHQKSKIKVIELLPPAVDTKLVKDTSLPKMPLPKFTKKLLRALESGAPEIRIGQSSLLYYFARLSPWLINKILNNKAYENANKF